jgi:cysteinyl-tRNA synthetase
VGEKMSKSLGNFVTIRDLLKDWPGQVVRFAMLQTHYRQPIDWTASRLDAARQEMGDWAGLFYGSDAEHDYVDRKLRNIPARPTSELLDALLDDLNTPKAISILRRQFSERLSQGLSAEFLQNCEFIGLINPSKIRALEGLHVSGSVRPALLFEAMPHVMKIRAGIANALPDVVDRECHALRMNGIRAEIREDGHVELLPLQKSDELDTSKINGLIESRATARRSRDFAEADRIRSELAGMGVEVEDRKDGTTTWKVKR